MAMLDLSATEDDDSVYTWERVTPADPDHMPATQRLMHVLADRTAWKAALTSARLRAEESPPDSSAMPRRAA
jgi:hypothetical protein